MTQPVRRFRAPPITASVFLNEPNNDQSRPFYTVALQRTYKDREGNFKHTSTFRVEDLHKAILVLERAYGFLVGEAAPTVKPPGQGNERTPRSGVEPQQELDVLPREDSGTSGGGVPR